ncbi:hypothetical protein HID58_079755 [Brassica napus]|uniref:Transcription factor n=2 Tax=Brassica TaxID=3705 RepID=A0ABQ7Y481_BRANA|nr:hypothetical protein HID58_079755 [Brassica napus]VDD54416.1 unnamed protein product [Brassica oleracea]
MAKKKLNPLEDPPKSSSSDDEVETLSGEEEEEEEEAEEQISDDSSSEEEDDLMDPVIIPPARKPKSPARHAVASGSKKLTAVTVASPSKPGSKRSSEEISPKKVHAKRSKKEDSKKPLFQRLWSEEDEIYLLQGMIDFNSETGKSPYEDMDGFYEFIKKSISFEASKYQTVEKIRSLRKKYVKKVRRGVESLPKAHDMECFKLSKYIWGSNGMALKSNLKKKIDSVKPHGKEVEKDVESYGSLKKKLDFLEANEGRRRLRGLGKKVEVDKEVLVNGDSKSVGVMSASDWFEDSFLVGSIASLGVGERFVKQKWSMVAVETKKKMEEKWKLLQAKEMELVLQKTDFMREVGSVIAEAS